MTITVDDDANQDIYTYCVVALAYTGHDTTTPIAGWVDSGSTDIGDGAHSLTLAAAPAAGDETLACLSIDADGTQTSPSWSGFTEIYDVVRGDGGASLAVAYRTGSTSTTVSVTDVFTESGSFYKGSMLAFTVKASAASPVTLTVQDAAHGHTAESPALTQTHILAAADAAHNHAAENVTLTQTHNLSVDDALHGHTVDSPALTQTHNLTAADAAHAHTADSPDLGQTHILEIQDAFHAQTADNVTLTVAVTLEVQDARHGHSAENVTFTQTHILGVAGALHVHLVDVVTLMIIQRIVMVNSIVIEQISVSGQVQELFQVDSIVAELFSVNSEDAI